MIDIKRLNPLNSMKFWGLIAMAILVVEGGMIVYSFRPSTLEANGSFDASMSDRGYYYTLYWASDYGVPSQYSGNPYWYSVERYAGESINVTAIAHFLCVDSVYLMYLSTEYHRLETGYGRYMENKENNSIKINEFNIAMNVVPLGIIDIPERNDLDYSWRIVFFCRNMARRGSGDYNPDGYIEIIIEVIP